MYDVVIYIHIQPFLLPFVTSRVPRENNIRQDATNLAEIQSNTQWNRRMVTTFDMKMMHANTIIPIVLWYGGAFPDDMISEPIYLVL